MVEIIGLGVVVLVQLATVIWMFATLTARVKQIGDNVEKLADIPTRVKVIEARWEDGREARTNPGGFRRPVWNDGEGQ